MSRIVNFQIFLILLFIFGFPAVSSAKRGVICSIDGTLFVRPAKKGCESDETLVSPTSFAGDQGDSGADGSTAAVNGVTAGGSLSGTYPNPQLAPGIVSHSKLGVFPYVSLSAAGLDSLTTGVEGVAAFTSEGSDDFLMFDAAVSDTQITVPLSGVYLASVAMTWHAGNNIGGRRISIYVNDSLVSSQTRSTATFNVVSGFLAATLSLSASDVVTVRLFQDSGVSFSPDALAFQMQWVAPAPS